MSKYRIKEQSYLHSIHGITPWYYVQVQCLWIFWVTLEEFSSELKAREYLENLMEMKKRKVKILEVIEEK